VTATGGTGRIKEIKIKGIDVTGRSVQLVQIGFLLGGQGNGIS